MGFFQKLEVHNVDKQCFLHHSLWHLVLTSFFRASKPKTRWICSFGFYKMQKKQFFSSTTMTKSHFSKQSHLKTQTSSHFEKKNAVYYFNNTYLMDISANLKQNCAILCRKILLEMLHNMGLTFVTPWPLKCSLYMDFYDTCPK